MNLSKFLKIPAENPRVVFSLQKEKGKKFLKGFQLSAAYIYFKRLISISYSLCKSVSIDPETYFIRFIGKYLQIVK